MKRAVIIIVALILGASKCEGTPETQDELQADCWDRCEPVGGTFLCTISSLRFSYKSVIRIREAAFLDRLPACLNSRRQ